MQQCLACRQTAAQDWTDIPLTCSARPLSFCACLSAHFLPPFPPSPSHPPSLPPSLDVLTSSSPSASPHLSCFQRTRSLPPPSVWHVSIVMSSSAVLSILLPRLLSPHTHAHTRTFYILDTYQRLHAYPTVAFLTSCEHCLRL